MNKTLIPEDNSIESIKTREKIIRDFYREWKEQNPLQRKYNVALKEYINIRMVSIVETSEHAAKTISLRWQFFNSMPFWLVPRRCRYRRPSLATRIRSLSSVF